MKPRIRLRFLGFFFALAFIGIIIRAFHLQMLPHKKVENLVVNQQKSKLEVVGRRGTIVDRNGRELAVSVNSLSVYANPHLIKDLSKVTRTLSLALDLPEAALRKKLKYDGKRKYVWILRQLDPKQMQRVTELQVEKLEGVGVLPEFRRTYPQESLASHVLGFVSIDGQGLEGVEKKFDNVLTRDKAITYVSKDALGRPVLERREQIQMELSRGDSIELTIDSAIQNAAEVALREAIQKHQALSGTAIVMDPRSGEILALANEPSFDPNNVSSSPGLYRKNRALTDPIEPASVLKSFVVAKALEEKVISENSRFNTSDGKIKVGKKWIKEADHKHRLKSVTIADLIRVSSNVGTVLLQQKMGYEKMYEIYRDLGFEGVSGIDMGSESRGIFRKAKKEQVLEQATQSFGQGISLTPMQIVRSYGVLAGDGMLPTPTLIKGIHKQNGEFEAIPQKPKTRVLSEATVIKMRKLLEQVVEEEGTGTLARVEGIRVAGKTGTAQKVDFANGGYKKGAYWASFIGFLPSTNPQFLIYVLIDEPSDGNYYGGTVAAPVFQRIARAALRLSDFLPRLAAAPKSPQKAKAVFKGDVKNLETTKNCVLENYVGASVTKALKKLEDLGCARVELLGQGSIVVEQEPKVGSTLSGEQTLYLKLR